MIFIGRSFEDEPSEEEKASMQPMIALLALSATTLTGSVVPAIRTRDGLIAGCSIAMTCLASLMLAGVVMDRNGPITDRPTSGIVR